MTDGEDEPLELTDEVIEPLVPANDDGEGESVIAFADEADADEPETPLIKKLRDQVRTLSRKVAQNGRAPANDDDPEPTIPAKPSFEGCEFDQDRFDAAADAREQALLNHAEWKTRQAERSRSREAAQNEQARQIEQQRKALGVSDYEDRAAVVKDRLSDAQLAILINGAENPAQLIYALGRSPNRLDQIAGEDNLARFAVQIGKLEKDVKVSKRKPPQAEERVRGATASTAIGSDKELNRLEAEAARSGNRTEVIRYKRKLKDRAA